MEFSTDILDILPNPVLVKNQNLEYVWVNKAFEELFGVTREGVVGCIDKELFPQRQVSQCNGGDLRVLESGEIDEAVETVFEENGNARETITRKSRLQTGQGKYYLIGVMHDITDVTRANEALTRTQAKLEQHAVELVRLATTDALTGCSNRRALDECEEQVLQDQSQSATLLLLDIDNFKSINDTYGHDFGDTVLQHFSRIIGTQISTSDYFIRLGGEEFAISKVGLTREGALVNADNLRCLVENTPLVHKGERFSFTVSVGISHREKGTVLTLDQMLSEADSQLYAAKAAGRNLVSMAA